MPEKPNLLIVDDEEHVTRSLKRSLRDQYNVFTANSAREALDILNTQNVGVVLTDQRMPDMTGVELLTVVREKYPFATGIILSGYSDSSALADALNLGSVRGFIPKPWDMDIVRNKLQEAVKVFESLIKPNDGAASPDAGFDHQQLDEMKSLLEMLSANALDSLFQPAASASVALVGEAALNYQFLDRMQDGFAAIRADGSFLFCNAVFSKMLSIHEITPSQPVTMADLQPFPEIVRAIEKGLSGEYTHTNGRIFSPAGRLYFLEIGTTPVSGADNTFQTVLVLRDQTEREQTIAHLKSMNTVAAALTQTRPFSAALALALQACTQGFMADAAAAFFKKSDELLFQYEGSVGLHPDTIAHLVQHEGIRCTAPGENSSFAARAKTVLEIESEGFQIFPDVCESEKIASAAVAPMFDATGLVGFLAVFTRYTRLFDGEDLALLTLTGDQIAGARLNELLVDELQRQAHFDNLTGLYNRGYFFDLAERLYQRARKRQSPLAAFMIDADHFKPINDHYGHLVGDRALKKIAEVLNACIRPLDLICRYGGDEFALLIPDCDPEIAENITERILTLFEATRWVVEGQIIKLSVSVGYTMVEFGPDETLESLLNRSDTQMYLNKRQKK